MYGKSWIIISFVFQNVKKLEYVEIEKKDIYYIFLIIEINRVIIQN